MQSCDHTSVGALIYNERGQLLMFQRGTPPWGVAGPAGHCDGDSYQKALQKEVGEEVGLRVLVSYGVAAFRIEKACQRPYNGEPYHNWRFYVVEVAGTIIPSQRETREVRWYSRQEIVQLMQRTRDYHLLGMLSERVYEASPGLDLSWYRLFCEYPDLLQTPTLWRHAWSQIEPTPLRGKRR